LSPTGRIELANQQLLNFFGKTLDEINAWAVSDAVHPDDLPHVIEAHTRSMTTGTPYDFEGRCRRADGVYRWFQLRNLPMCDSDGRIIGWSTLMTDIEDRKRAEEALRKSEYEARLIVDSIPGLVCTLNPAGQIDLANRPLLDFFGMTLEELNSWGSNGAVHPDDLERVIVELTHAMTTGTEFHSEIRYRRADGLYRWSQTRILPVRDKEGRITRWYGLITDIDEQKRAEEKLRESEHESRLIVDSIPGLIAVLSASGEVERVNQPLLDYLGKSLEEARQWAVDDTVHPDDRSGYLQAFAQAFATGDPVEYEAVRVRRFDGVYRWLNMRGLPLRDRQGHIVRWYFLLTEIDDRKRAEEALRESENESRLIVDSVPGMIAVLSASGDPERVSQPLLDYFGRSLEECRQWAVDDSIHPDDRPGYLQAFGRSFAAGDPVEYEAMRIRRFDGVYRWFNARGLPLRDRQGHIVRWYFLLTEIDDRKRAEDELRRSEARHRVVVETASDAVVSIDESGAIILANPATKRIFGYNPEELIGKPLTVLMPGAMGKHHETGFKRYLETGVRQLNWQGTEMTARRANGEEFPAEVSFGEMTVDQRRVFTGFIRDISEKKRSEEELRNTQAELTKMMRVMTIGQLTASIAHEVNQPLSGIITNASTCLRMLKSNPPNIDGAQETAQRTIRDGNRASEVITRLRTLFSKKQIDFEPLDINEVAREVVALLSGELQRNNVILKQELGDRLPTVNGDRIQLQQVILNLLRNASDAMRDVEDRPRQIVLRTDLEDEHVRLSVQDSGVGFTPDVADQMFESFYTTKSDGMGVGLSVSRSIIEANRGRLWATANEGPGATFAFSIPCEQGSHPQDAP
jgi:PAS domain S-box-containing protein